MNIRFVDGHSIQHLVSSCPNLQKLTLYDCDWDNVEAVCISAPMLKFLVIFDVTNNEDSSGCEVVIFGMNVGFFYYVYTWANSKLSVACIYSPLLVEECTDVKIQKLLLSSKEDIAMLWLSVT